jgi:hypothetical protein
MTITHDMDDGKTTKKMNEYKRYQHLERYGTTEVIGIETGECYIFPKLDGSNGSIYLESSQIKAGSRSRVLSIDKDNAGFYAHVINEKERYGRILHHLHEAFSTDAILYGEWLVPHSFKDYKDDAWRKFYVFDVYVDGQPLPYNVYQPMLEYFVIDYVPCVSIIRNGTESSFIHEMENRSHFLCKEGVKMGEGIVIKNYDFVNQYGRKTWAKIVSNEFKAMHFKAMGPLDKNFGDSVEKQIAEKYCTAALCEKELNKIAIEGWESKKIPQLLNTIYYCVVKEDTWEFVKEHKNPTINFKSLQQFVFNKVKQNLPKVF